MQGSKMLYASGGSPGLGSGITALPVTFSQFNRSGSLETAIMVPALMPW